MATKNTARRNRITLTWHELVEEVLGLPWDTAVHIYDPRTGKLIQADIFGPDICFTYKGPETTEALDTADLHDRAVARIVRFKKT